MLLHIEKPWVRLWLLMTGRLWLNNGTARFCIACLMLRGHRLWLLRDHRLWLLLRCHRHIQGPQLRGHCEGVLFVGGPLQEASHQAPRTPLKRLYLCKSATAGWLGNASPILKWNGLGT